MANDSLAKGAKSATFGPPKVDAVKWNALWTDAEEESKFEDCPLSITRYPYGTREDYPCTLKKNHKGNCKPSKYAKIFTQKFVSGLQTERS